MPAHDPFYDDPAFVRFYDPSEGWGPAFDAAMRLAEGAGSVLDLGCGTGVLAVALARTRREVWGVDPAGAMLDVARERPGGAAVTWVEAPAQDFDLGRRFDLICMTGHAFQCLLTEADRRAMLRRCAVHLAPNGRLIFDSWSPRRRVWGAWTPQRQRFEVEVDGVRALRWSDAAQDPVQGIVAYRSHVLIEGAAAPMTAVSRLAFPSREALVADLAAADLHADRWFGDWQGAPWTPEAENIIPVARLD
ncbi:MAG: class I SAM-dependent methyltransferase [Pseudomonadota bacterium]